MTLECKICGVSDVKTLNFIVNHKFPPKFIGFIVNYPKSKRFVEINKLKDLININKKKSKFVAVLVKPGDEIFIEVEFQQKLSKFYFLKGKVLKEEKIVLTIEFALAIVED